MGRMLTPGSLALVINVFVIGSRQIGHHVQCVEAGSQVNTNWGPPTVQHELKTGQPRGRREGEEEREREGGRRLLLMGTEQQVCIQLKPQRPSFSPRRSLSFLSLALALALSPSLRLLPSLLC